MSKFRPLLENRICYPTATDPFSPEYLDLLSRLRPGWYFHRENWLHRLYLQIDETDWHISCFNFILDWEMRNCDMNNCDFYKSCTIFNKSIDNAIKAMDDHFQNFCHMEDEALLTYYLENYGFIIVSPTRSKMLLFDEREHAIEKNRPLFVEIYKNSPHLEVLWNPEDKLVVTCHFPAETCFCAEKNQELSPIPYQFLEEYESSTRHNDDQSALKAWRDVYRLTNLQKVRGVRYST